MEPITKSAWDELSGKAKWDSLVALRGPDYNDSEIIKMFSASVVRHRLSGVIRVGGLVSKMGCIIAPKGLAPNGTFDAHHYFTHQLEAAYHLGIPATYAPTEVYKEAISTGAAHAACGVFLKAIDEGKMTAPEGIKEALTKGAKGYGY